MGSRLQKIDFESLALVDGGKINAALETHLKRASLDCQDRPGDAKARVVTCAFTFVPVMDQSGFCEEVKWDVQVKSKVPAHQSKAFSAALRRDGSFVFSEDSLENVNQGTLGYDDGDDE